MGKVIRKSIETFYDVLGLPPASTFEQLHARFKELALECHPDKFKEDSKRQKEAAERFYKISGAWAVLKSPTGRKLYDAQMKLTMNLCGVCHGDGIIVRTIGFSRKESKICETCDGKGHV